jgi:uncharacterized protein (TIGR00369 family)
MCVDIVNPFDDADDSEFQCFGCSSSNPLGLHLKFKKEGHEVIAEWCSDRRYEGYPKVLHGGIQATIMDELASWVVYTQCGTAGVTSGMEVKYLHPLSSLGVKIIIRGHVVERREKEVVIAVQLMDEIGKVYTQANVTYYIFPEAIARRRYAYPGLEAFFKPEK